MHWLLPLAEPLPRTPSPAAIGIRHHDWAVPPLPPAPPVKVFGPCPPARAVAPNSTDPLAARAAAATATAARCPNLRIIGYLPLFVKARLALTEHRFIGILMACK